VTKQAFSGDKIIIHIVFIKCKNNFKKTIYCY